MPFCTYCGQSFTRDEHLERHILTHTNVKPYKCFTCHMSFARRDLLHRHYTVHGKDGNQDPLPASNGIVPKSAGRTPIACSNCAKTKTKCDKKFPCTRCATRNLKCTVRPTRRMTKNAARIASDEKLGASDSEAHAASASNSGDSSHGSPISDRKLLPHSGPVTPVDNASPLSSKTQDSCMGHAHSHTHTHTPPSSTGISADGTPGSHMAHTTPVSGYSDFMPGSDSRDDCDHSSSPQFLLDWSQMQMPFGFDQARPDMMFSPGLPYTPGGFMDGGLMDPMGFMPPPTSGGMPNLMTQMQIPLPTPGLDRLDPGFPASAPAVLSMEQSYFTPRPSSISHSNPDNDVNTSSVDAWSAFRCTPQVPASACPKSAKQNLERLEQGLKSHDSWSSWRPTWDEADYALGDKLMVSPLQEMPRDKLLAITQTFLHKALDIHKDEQSIMSSAGSSPMGYQSSFVILPPARVLEFFLQSYVNGFERYYPLTAKGTLNANELLRGYNDKASSLLILLMIAQGAMITPSVDARWLTAGLTEACRISLFDLIEKNIMLSGDSQVLHSALLFTVQAAWSGDKWQMDIAMGQRGMYLAMLRHSGQLGPRQRSHMMNQGLNVDALWSEWVQDESRSRLIYSWAMVDQDLSLFYDTAPLFSVTEFGEPMPDSDGLWHAKSAHEWSGIFEQVHEFAGGYSSVGSGARPLSLRDLFRHFLDDAILSQGIELTPLHLRLLLHPLQSLVCQFRQLLSCFSDNVMSRAGSRSVTAATTRVRLEEVQAMLQRWYGLADRYMKMNPMCPLMQANLVMFHLISLNTVTNFPEIEKLARREEFDGSYQQLSWLHKRCISDVEEAIFHCGQVIRHVRSMPRSIRPPWWAAAIYRASLILWTDSLTHNDTLTPTSGLFPSMETNFAVDSLPPDHPMVVRYLTKREGSPMLTKRDGSLMPIDNAFGVLFHCVDVVGEGVSTRFSDGIRSKLERLAKGAN